MVISSSKEEESEKNFYQILSTSLKAELNKRAQSSQFLKGCCIYRVPQLLRKLNEEAYTPVQVSIGPFHHKNERLLPMDTHKLMYVWSFIENSGTNPDLNTYLDNLNPYIEIIKNKESEIRECYAEPIDMPTDKFLKMILIDSIFVIEFLRTGNAVKPFTKGEISHDLRLAENQLPLFILEELYSAAFRKPDTSSTSTVSFTHLACEFFKVDKRIVEVDANTNEAAAYCHFLDLLRLSRISRSVAVGVDNTNILCPTATSLYEAGVKFLVRDTPCSIRDIHFDKEKGLLTIPKLRVDGSTRRFLINLLAFEQCHYNLDSTYITNYLYFMDCLINTAEDVQLLVNAGIIENLLSTDQKVADLFNTLVSQAYISPPDYCYKIIAQQLNHHCNKSWNRYKATLKQKYFNHPWAVISVIYAVTLLLLTITQVVTGILAMPGVKK